jgi:hypothetical protein
MDIGRIEATLSARFDKDPFDKYDRALEGAHRDAAKDVTADLKGDYDGAAFDKYDRELTSAQREARKGATANLDARADTRSIDRYKRSLDGADRSQRATGSSAAKTAGGMTALASNARMLAGAAAVGGLIVAFRSMYQEQSEAQAASAQLRAVLESMGKRAGVSAKQVESLSAAIAKKSALDDEAVISASNLMLTFGEVRNEAGKNNNIFDRSIQVTSDLSRAFGKDLNMSAIMVGKALNDPIKGVSALSRVGIQFTDQQKTQIEAMVASGDQLKAQKMIMGELEEQVGGSAEAYGKTLPGAVDRAKFALLDLAERAGGFIAPAVSAVADVIEGLADGSLFKGKGNVLAPIIEPLKGLGDALAPIFEEVKGAFSDLFGGSGGKEFTKDLRALAEGVGAVIGVVVSIIKRAAPGIAAVFRGIIKVVGGFVKVIGGILRGDFGRVWSGLKDIVSGALGGIFGAIRAATAPIRELFARLFGGIGDLASGGFRAVLRVIRGAASGIKSAALAVARGVVSGFDFIKKVPGNVKKFIEKAIDGVASLPSKAFNAAVKVGKAIIDGIGSGLSRMGSFLSNIGRGIADWINAKTAFGNRIDIGPVSVTLPALAQGGRVGPSLRGAQMFIAGEGGKDEWVISQEGDRRKNIGWAMEALKTLTGRDVGLYRKGKGPRLLGAERRLSKIAPGWGSGLSRKSSEIERKERIYGQRDREFSISSEEFLTDNPDGSVSLNQAGIDKRVSELNTLISLREEIQRLVSDLFSWITSTSALLRKAITKVSGAMSRTKRGSDARKGYAKRLGGYREALSALSEAAPEVDLDREDERLSLLELNAEKSAILGTTVPSSAGGGDTSPEGVARAAAEQVASFQANRAELFGSFGQNFIGIGGTVTPLTAAAGMRYLGGGQSDGGLGILGAAGGSGMVSAAGAGRGSAISDGVGGVIITNNYQAPPPDPHTWSQSLAWEIRTAVG